MADENKKGITVKIDGDLHAQVKAYIESRGMTMAEFITAACDDLLRPKIAEKEEKKIHVLFWWGCHRVTRELSENKTTKACRTSSPGNRRRPSHANRRYL